MWWSNVIKSSHFPSLVGGWAYPSEKYESNLGSFPIYGKIKNVPNHQRNPISIPLSYSNWTTVAHPFSSRQGVVANVTVPHLQHLTLPGTSGVWNTLKKNGIFKVFFLGNGMLMGNDYGMFMGYNIPMVWVMIIILIVIA